MGRGAVREVTLTCDGSHRVKFWCHKVLILENKLEVIQKGAEPNGQKRVAQRVNYERRRNPHFFVPILRGQIDENLDRSDSSCLRCLGSRVIGPGTVEQARQWREPMLEPHP